MGGKGRLGRYANGSCTGQARASASGMHLPPSQLRQPLPHRAEPGALPTSMMLLPLLPTAFTMLSPSAGGPISCCRDCRVTYFLLLMASSPGSPDLSEMQGPLLASDTVPRYWGHLNIEDLQNKSMQCMPAPFMRILGVGRSAEPGGPNSRACAGAVLPVFEPGVHLSTGWSQGHCACLEPPRRS